MTSILSKGLKHSIETPDVSNLVIFNAYKRFSNSLLWQIHFKDQEDDNFFNPKLYKAMKPFLPCPKECYPLQKSEHPAFLSTEKHKKQLMKLLRLNPASRSSGSELRNIQLKLKQFPLVKFIASDKNLGLVALDVEYYTSMVLSHLFNVNNYTHICPFDERLSKDNLSSAMQEMHDMILESKPNDTFLRKFFNVQKDFDIPKFHVLIKLHKWKDRSLLAPSRPIAGAVNWITTFTSIYLTEELTPYINSDVVLKNSGQLIENIDSFNSNPIDFKFIVTWDVEALYPSIDLNTLYTRVLLGKPSIITTMAQFIFDNSIVSFNGRLYHQTNGIAMGTNCAVVIANLYMQTLIDCHFATNPKVLLYKRFIDDMFHLWSGTHDEFLLFYNEINNLVPGLRFTYKLSPTSIEFLDLQLINLDGKIHFHLFQKELNKYAYLTPLSCHPRATIHGFIKGELIRIMRSSSTIYYYEKFRDLFLIRLLQRGYTFKVLNNIFKLPYRRHYQMPATIQSSKILPLIIPFTRRIGIDDKLKELVRNITPDIIPFLPTHKPMLVYSMVANILSTFTSSSLSPEQSTYLEKL